MVLNRKWYALYTRAGCEKKVAGFLQRKKINCYVPINQVAIEGFTKKTVLKQPLFPSYVFVHVPESELDYLKKIAGVTGLVHWVNEPATFPNADIELIRRFISQHVTVQLKKTRVSTSEMAKIVKSIFVQNENRDLSENDKLIKLFLPSLGCILTATAEPVLNKTFIEELVYPDYLVMAR